MEILAKHGSVTEVSTPLVAVNLFEGVTTPGGATGAVDKALGGMISRLIAEGEIKGKLDEVTLIHTQGKVPAQRVAVLGLGPKEKFGLDAIRRASGTLLKRCRELGITSFHTIVHGAGDGGLGADECAGAIVEGALLAAYGYKQFKTTEQPKAVERITLVEADARKVPAIEAGIRLGLVYAGATATARDLAATPPNMLYPETLAERGESERQPKQRIQLAVPVSPGDDEQQNRKRDEEDERRVQDGHPGNDVDNRRRGHNQTGEQAGPPVEQK